MGNFFSSNSSGAQRPTQRNITGDFSGTSGSGNQINSCNQINSGNITNNYHSPVDSSEKQTEILQCLYKSAYESHRSRVREPAEGTCTWVTEHPKFMEWVGKKAAALLWLSADLGCGKSVMASFLVDHLKARTDAIVCYFFFKDDNEEQRSATSALCAILHQLFLQKYSLCRYAEEAFKAKGNRFAEEVGTLWDILVEAVAEGGYGDVICVVDALDECEEETIAPLIHHITHLPGSQTSDTPLKFLVTSRPYHRFERDLGSPATTIRLRGEDEVDAITSDVTRVIDEGIDDLEKYWERPGGLQYLRTLLESSADRTFLWVSLVLGILKDNEDGSPEDFTNIARTAPSDLAELYTKILDRARSPDKARRILMIVVAAARPLTLREMSIALRIAQKHNSMENIEDLPGGFEKVVKGLCGLFVRVIDSKIYLVHQTAREFLIKGSLPGRGNWQYTLCPKNSNHMMAEICISYLSRKEFASSPLTIDIFGNISEEAVKDYLQKYSFLDYAARYWPDHFRDSEHRGMELFELTRLICEDGPNHCLTWFQVHWFNTRWFYRFPKDFTHLMIASWLGQGMVVDRLLEEGNINARSSQYGTALNISALRKDEGMTRKLLRKNVKAYLGGREYNILQTKKSELKNALEYYAYEGGEGYNTILFLMPFCIPDSSDPPASPDRGTTSS